MPAKSEISAPSSPEIGPPEMRPPQMAAPELAAPEIDLPETPQAQAEAAAKAFTEGLETAAIRTQHLYDSSMKSLNHEGQLFFEGMAKDGAAAIAALKDCRSPLDLLGVEQAWLMARTRAYVDSGLRLFETALTGAAPGVDPEPHPFVLPD